MDATATDVRYALRSFRKAPAFFLLVIAILALGIGTSVSIFSLVDGVLFRPLPYSDPQRLVTLTTYAAKPPFSSNGSVSYNDFEQFEAKSRSFSDLAVTFRTGWSRVTLTGGAEPVRAQGAFVSPNFFSIFRRTPILGRGFTTEEDSRAERVVVISEVLWRERFGSSPDVLAQDLEMGHVRWRVIGVMPADFQVPFLDTQLWAPVRSHPDWNNTEGGNPLDQARWDVFGRLKPGLSLAVAQAEVASIRNGLRLTHPAFPDNEVRVVPLREHFTEQIRNPLFVLFAAVTFLLLIACANVANLLLARAAQREREMAVRAALGAGQGRIARQLVTESLTFSLLAGVLGTTLAFALTPILQALSPVDMPLLGSVAVDGRVLAFAVVLSGAIGVILGMTPALRPSRANPNSSLGAASHRFTDTRGSRRMKSVFVAAEFALAMVLLTGAGMLIRSFVAVLQVNLGFHPEQVLTIQIGLPDNTPAAQSPRFYQDLMLRLSALPGVQAVGGASNLFYLDERRSHALRLVEGHAPEPTASWKPLVWTQVAGNYLQTMRIPLVRGRWFTDTDRAAGPPVAVINEALAQRYWPRQDPIGKRLKGFDPRGRNDDWLTVVGVVKNSRVGGLEKAPFAQIYELQTQRPVEQLSYIVIRAAGNINTLAASARNLIHGLNRNVIVSSISTMEQLVDQQKVQRRFQTWVIGVFSGLALALAALGVFAVMHYSVAARTAEMGIRIAVGATGTDIVWMVMGSGAALALSGIAAGVVAAIWLTRAIAGFLYEVSSDDPVSFAGACFVLLTVAILAAYFPARRAARVDPMMALRQE